MKHQTNHDLSVLAYNACVQKAYFAILKQAKALLSNLEHQELRHSLIREDKKPIAPGIIVHEFISFEIYLRLECHKDNKLAINFGVQAIPGFADYEPLGAQFVRILYKLTMANQTAINIEDCIRTDFIITETTELYEYIEERNKSNHTFQLIPYKPKQVKRKLRKVA